MAGGFYSYKRFDILIDAIALLPDRPGIRAVFAGGGPLEESLRQQAVARGVQDRIEFAGVQHDMPAFMRRLDVYAVTSDTGEASPYAHLEAMSTGLPSVCSLYRRYAHACPRRIQRHSRPTRRSRRGRERTANPGLSIPSCARHWGNRRDKRR